MACTMTDLYSASDSFQDLEPNVRVALQLWKTLLERDGIDDGSFFSPVASQSALLQSADLLALKVRNISEFCALHTHSDVRVAWEFKAGRLLMVVAIPNHLRLRQSSPTLRLLFLVEVAGLTPSRHALISLSANTLESCILSRSSLFPGLAL
jgi:hypothetical protein